MLALKWHICVIIIVVMQTLEWCSFYIFLHPHRGWLWSLPFYELPWFVPIASKLNTAVLIIICGRGLCLSVSSQANNIGKKNVYETTFLTAASNIHPASFFFSIISQQESCRGGECYRDPHIHTKDQSGTDSLLYILPQSSFTWALCEYSNVNVLNNKVLALQITQQQKLLVTLFITLLCCSAQLHQPTSLYMWFNKKPDYRLQEIF